MTVPITSDLVGYQRFWLRVVLGVAVWATIVVLELGAIVWTLWRG